MKSISSYKKMAGRQLRGIRLIATLSAFIALFTTYLPLILCCLYVIRKPGAILVPLFASRPDGGSLSLPSLVFSGWFVPALFLSIVFAVLMTGCFKVGLCRQFLLIREEQDVSPATTYSGLYYARGAIALHLLCSIAILIGGVLLVVPAIMLICRLWAAPFLLVEENELGILGTIRKSFIITRGYTGKILTFGLSYILWIIVPLILIIYNIYMAASSMFVIAGGDIVNVNLYLQFLLLFLIASLLVLMIYGAYFKNRAGVAFANFYKDLKEGQSANAIH